MTKPRIMTSPSPPTDSSLSNIATAIRALWAEAPSVESLGKTPAFHALVEAYRASYPGAGSRSTLDFALREAVRRLGLGSGGGQCWQDAAARIEHAAAATFTKRLHLCPLDWAGELPFLSFGPNGVQTFTKAELGKLIEEASASPFDALKDVDLAALARFRWLVVRETVSIAPDPGRRILPGLFFNIGEDFGRIEPHRRRFPAAVERALFCLLAIPWEDLTRESSADWRPFQTPWVWTIDDDLFSRRATPPDPASLTWDLRHYEDEAGFVEEYEVPLAVRLDDDADDSATTWLDDDAWARFERAAASPILTLPAMHFFITGLLADGVDEFLAHLTTIEACLGQEADHKGHPDLPDGSRGATARTAWRLGQILNDPAVSQTFRKLFKLRSHYVHGETMGDISGTDRTAARQLARRCICAVVSIASTAPSVTDRTVWLDSLIPPPPPKAPPPERKGKKKS